MTPQQYHTARDAVSAQIRAAKRRCDMQEVSRLQDAQKALTAAQMQAERVNG